MKHLFTFLSALALGYAPLNTVTAETLGDLVSQRGFEWMIGTWADKATDGQALKVSYEWRLEKNAIAVKLHTQDRESEGFIARHPESGEVSYVAADNRGGGAIGKYAPEGGKLVLKVTYQRTDGETRRLAVVHEKQGDDGQKVTIHRIEENGELGEVRDTIELKRVNK